MFIHLDNLKGETDLKATMIDGTRFYEVPSGKMYPSITSVTSFYNREVFVEWRKKVGDEKANKITRESTYRGTKFHDAVELYIKNTPIKDIDMLLSTKFLLLSAKKNLDRINNIHVIEQSLYSDYLGLAGRVDCIAEYDGELAVIDFKTSTKIKPKNGLKTTSCKETAYACMYYEMTGIPVKKLVTIMVAENGECVVYEKQTRVTILNFCIEYIRKFVDHKQWFHGESS